MAEAPKKDDKPAAMTTTATADTTAGAATPQRMGVRLAPGMAFIDFGFLEPSLLAALPRVAKEGGKLPQSVNGKLAVRVAMGYDGLAGLHQQIGRVLTALRAASTRAKDKH